MPPSAAPDLTANAWIVIYKCDLAAGLPRARGSGHACGSCSNNQDLRFNCKKERTTFTHHSSLITHPSSLLPQHSSLFTHHSSLFTHHSSLFTHHSSLFTHHSSLLHHFSRLHDKAHMFHQRYVGQRVASHSNQVGGA